MNLAWSMYRVAAPTLGALAPAGRWLAPSDERSLWDERLGRSAVPGGANAWIHAASMGEALAAEALVARLRALQPSARLHLTATTRGGRARLARLGASVSLAPFDAPQCVARFFRGVQPRRLFLIETELWVHWLLRCRDARVPVAVVSARLSPRSVLGYRRFGPALRELVGGLAGVLAQSEGDAERWLAIGAPPDRTEVIGNLKNDALPRPEPSRASARAARGLDPTRPLLVLGSLRPGEVRPLARAWKSLPAPLRERWQVVAIPRHPSASEDLREEAEAEEQPLVLEGVPRDGEWLWDARLGVLSGWYGAGEVAFVGGTLAPFGGHNPLEPAACGAAVIVGPHHQAQAEAMRRLLAEEAVWVTPSEVQLAVALESLLGDPRVCEARARAAARVAEAARGAAARATARLVAWSLWPEVS